MIRKLRNLELTSGSLPPSGLGPDGQLKIENRGGAPATPGVGAAPAARDRGNPRWSGWSPGWGMDAGDRRNAPPPPGVHGKLL